MLYPRIIPCLLVHNRGLVKTIQFKNPKYIGDPLNAVKIFNEKEVDELIVLDIDATIENKEPDYQMIQNLAVECRMPLCYGGGIRTIEQVQRIFALGVEKIAISAAALKDPELVLKIAKQVGNQSIVVVLDVKKDSVDNKYKIFSCNGQKNTGQDPVQVAMEMTIRGAGEIVINSINRDGMMNGYDLTLIDQIRKSINLPLTVLGGAGSLKDIKLLVSRYGIIGAAAGSLFVFKGTYHAVLINYPSSAEKNALIKEAYQDFLNQKTLIK
ncbi:MAG: AglZ/HisF2 family acetamidino modification protein [Patescibacteria group bacterium]|nr:AglZ/HisF2 family acetamidino modification protein [Patescibacteria group bacterium]MDD5121298.1 AglZ/HisF2 family acetamidino modification protein [Patescibacteria group bacterium]MDD5221728.1 AglZ/HisF2 family acetamidino modification protein [Patescibacteria group bacterium]MDD5395783.1 AglZ/HisF2 family acetamidino modification protein [Patescibacteria group bacterium]